LNNVPVNVYDVGIRSKSGRGDRFGLQVVSTSGAVIPDLIFDPITLRGGNIKR